MILRYTISIKLFVNLLDMSNSIEPIDFDDIDKLVHPIEDEKDTPLYISNKIQNLSLANYDVMADASASITLQKLGPENLRMEEILAEVYSGLSLDQSNRLHLPPVKFSDTIEGKDVMDRLQDMSNRIANMERIQKKMAEEISQFIAGFSLPD
jgi:hypothetical protein